jgi:hypothetical protein
MTDLVHKRQAAEIIEIKNRRGTNLGYEGAGRWINEAIAVIMITSDPDKWFSIEQLARIAYRSAVPSNQVKVRKRISKLFHYMFAHHRRVLIKEYERRVNDVRMKDEVRKNPLKGRPVIARVKIASFGDQAQAKSELEELRRHNDITATELNQMMDVVNLLAPPIENQTEEGSA